MPGGPIHQSAFGSEADLSRCVHCGLCLQHCPTYLETGLETESPRGRLHLIRALSEGRIDLAGNTMGHLDMCLQCRNCEAVCPSGVPYGRIMEHARAAVIESRRAPVPWRLRSLFLREVIARPGRLRALAAALRFYRRSGLRALAESIPLLRDRALLAPSIAGRPFTGTGVLARPKGEPVARVALLTGCIMPLAYGRVHRATVRVLAANGCEVIAPVDQSCCGALQAHNGDRQTAQALARRNIDAFLEDGCDFVVVNSAGCGAAMKEYGELLSQDAVYSERARVLAARVKDIHEFLLELPFRPPTGRLEASVTFQDPCHLAHAQRIREAPRRILQSIPGVQFVEMEHADRCCGSAGVYSFTQPQMSLQLLQRRIDEVRASGAAVVATANPGCMAQIEAGLRRNRLPVRVGHVIELLDAAYRAEHR
ncbi:MAG: 4Fe-4S dicluster domain-containing protein [Chloroflexi bacterium]|nr:MAG: 4Fe-4S dicluster domain-containing protein [Chloroflexota bacterium]